jgi:hypothetical protein
MSFGFILYRYAINNLRISKSMLKRIAYAIYYLLMGCMDFHSHVRWRALKRFLLPLDRNIELGAGIGLMSFQFV